MKEDQITKPNLRRRPSIDGLGVKRWRFASNTHPVHVTVFERPADKADRPYLIRLDHADGRCLAIRFATFQSEAQDRAEALLLPSTIGRLEKEWTYLC